MTLYELLMITDGWIAIYNERDDSRPYLIFLSEKQNEGYIKSWVTENALNRDVDSMSVNDFEERLDVYLTCNF